MAEFFGIFLLTIIFLSVCLFFSIFHYYKNRFTANFILIFIILTIDASFFCILPYYFLGESDGNILKIFLTLMSIFMFSSLILFVFFIETLYKKPLTPISISFCMYGLSILGMFSVADWYSIWDPIFGWSPQFPINMVYYAGSGVIIILFITLYRVLPFLSNRNQISIKKISVIVGITGVLIVVFVGIFGLSIVNKRPFLITFLILLGAIPFFASYYIDPHKFFLSNAKIYQIIITDNNSGFDLVSIGSNLLNATGFIASTIVQKELWNSSSEPQQYIFHDKAFLIQSQKIIEDRDVYAILISDHYNRGLENSLRFLLKKFIKNYGNFLKEELYQNISVLEDFRNDIVKIFDYAISKDNREEILRKR